MNSDDKEITSEESDLSEVEHKINEKSESVKFITKEVEKQDNKPKKEVLQRASKGRKIRYLKIPKAVDYMHPVKKSFCSDVQRINLITQLKDSMD
ncbi:hypothetical protein Ciccas_005059 [Cichlidogyrus casuarinus]|uniref:Apoptosis-antagonizing transcription factor C-terminal domain-containing protein n=1 Tax=Cichlidogyrus casuarinus TaxID=1844966 RepID=A0ABD2Q9R0_9PLAT